MLPAQTQIQANVRGNYSENGKCTIEVEVDGAAEVEARGAEARIRTLSGSPAIFRRMECSSPLPAAPADFRFQGIDGRGSQFLHRDPRQSGGVAVVRIDDPEGGRHGYTFDLHWSDRGNFSNNGNWGNTGYGGFGGNNNGSWDDNRRGNGRVNGGNNGRGNGNNGWDDSWNNGRGNGRGNGNNNGRNNGWQDSANAGNAMRACQAEVANQIRRNGYSDIQFLSAGFDNNRNNQDTISGTARAFQTFGSTNVNFTCRVDLATGRLWDVRLGRR